MKAEFWYFFIIIGLLNAQPARQLISYKLK